MGNEFLFCDKCGICCKNLDKNEIYYYLDSGNGICKNFDKATNLCKIYEKRPLICNVKEAYKEIYFKYMSFKEYQKLNQEGCQNLKNNNLRKRNEPS